MNHSYHGETTKALRHTNPKSMRSRLHTILTFVVSVYWATCVLPTSADNTQANGDNVSMAGLSEPPRPAPVATGQLGGVDVPSANLLKAMHGRPYVLHARGGKLNKVVAEKTLLPHDPAASPQSVYAYLGPDGAIYARLANIMCKSTDGGRSWTQYPAAKSFGKYAMLGNGIPILVGISAVVKDADWMVMSSEDEGRSWQIIANLQHPPGHYGGFCALVSWADDELLALQSLIPQPEKPGAEPTRGGARSLRSSDGGKTWRQTGALLLPWCSEGGIVRTPSGKLLASLRYQPPDRKFKHVALVDSHDNGASWQNFRLLTSEFGQTFSCPVALADGTVVVVHDTRYGPGSPGSRAMISRDEGQTWENEVYYLDHTTFSGSYNTSLALEDGTILTLAASSQAGDSVWIGTTDVVAIRWKPN
ncbi:MAG: hypothetical protein CMJ81_23065 [Planctomycetaceae bacterium]|nr:hypothetical protein [Planctomycetaceae bacterium]